MRSTGIDPRFPIALRRVLLVCAMTGLGCGGGSASDSRSRETPDAGVASDSAAMADVDAAGTAGRTADAADGDSWGTSPDGGPWSPLCPEQPPVLQTKCAQPGLSCEYGNAWWNVSCDTIVDCAGGEWFTGAAGHSPCLPAPGPNSASCPADPSTAVGGGCPSDGLTCYYGQGSLCQCGPWGGDAGLTWACFPGGGCPSARPRLGSPCTSTATCTYAPCDYAESCVDGVWQQVPTQCGP